MELSGCRGSYSSDIMKIRAVKLLSLSFIFLLILASIIAIPAAAEASEDRENWIIQISTSGKNIYCVETQAYLLEEDTDEYIWDLAGNYEIIKDSYEDGDELEDIFDYEDQDEFEEFIAEFYLIAYHHFSDETDQEDEYDLYLRFRDEDDDTVDIPAASAEAYTEDSIGWNPADWFNWLWDRIQDLILSIPDAIVGVFTSAFEFIEGTIYDIESWVVDSFDGPYAEAVALPIAMTAVMAGLFLLVYAIIWIIGAIPVL